MINHMGLMKKDLNIEVEEVLNCIQHRELKHSSFKRQFTLGEMLDGDNISSNFKDGILSIEIPKIEPTLPKEHCQD